MGREIGEEARGRITEAAAGVMRGAILDTGGREVFFAGSLNAQGLVEKVRVCARGHDGAVPALFEGLDARDVVLHNHPGGGIEPSEADLELAVIYSHNGHGVYIMDNDVARVYVVVEPFRKKDRHRLDFREFEKALRPDGAIARALPQFEVRPQQGEMMEAVCRAFNEEGMAVVEAPTGVGKTLAYLLPAIAWALRNRERVVISTRTINLQEQIVFKDIPLLQRCLAEKFTAVLVKGRQNYVCPRRLERALSEATLFDDEDTQEELKAIQQWAEHTEDGSKSDLSFVPSRTVWERVCSESDTCTAAQCQSSNGCFVPKARREVAQADLVVVNHHMLFSDLAIKKEIGSFSALAVLPAYDRLILDEAHHIEDSATEYFGIEAARNGAMALLGRFVRSERGRERGLIPLIKLRLMKEVETLSVEKHDAIMDFIDNSVQPSIAAAREALDLAFKALRSLTAERCGQIGRDIRWRLTEKELADPDLREIHGVYVLPAVEEVHVLAQHCTALLKDLDAIRPAAAEEVESPLVMEAAQLGSYRDRLVRLGNALAEVTSESLEPNTVRWIEIDAQNTSIVRVARCPLEVGKPLAEWVYPNLKTIVMTSATLSVQKSFNFLFKRIGLDLVKDRTVECLELDSPFDFDKQAILGIPDDMVTPDNARFLEESTEWMGKSLSITRGRAFILFTSFYALNFAYSRLEKGLRKAGVSPLKQGSLARTPLLERFRSDISSVLFGTDSFWEGVDVAGEALQCVILPKLPFRVPTEPILQARAEAIEAEGGNAFMEYTVPLAVIKFRQGFGRLIRRRSDQGAILVLDSRVLTKRYGRMFLESLPGLRVVSGPGEGVLQALREFFGNHQESES